jgi:hypothetical protein
LAKFLYYYGIAPCTPPSVSLFIRKQTHVDVLRFWAVWALSIGIYSVSGASTFYVAVLRWNLASMKLMEAAKDRSIKIRLRKTTKSSSFLLCRTCLKMISLDSRERAYSNRDKPCPFSNLKLGKYALSTCHLNRN